MDLNRSATRILVAGLALGVAVDLLFHGRSLGISFPLFVALAVAALLVLGRTQGVAPVWRNLWLLVPLAFVAAMVAVRANPFVTFLNVAAGLALLAMVAFFYAGGRVESLGLLGYPLVWLRTGGNALFQGVPVLQEALRRDGDGPRPRQRLAPVLRGLILALPVLLVFTCLLSSADLVFGRYVSDLFRLRFWREVAGRGFVVLAAGWVLAGALTYALRRADGQGFADRLLDGIASSLGRGEPAEGEDALGRALTALGRAIPLGLVEAAIVLGAVDLLFLFFVGLQFAYLFGGQANISAQGFTYADYARRGFAELVMVAILTLGLILGLKWLTQRGTRGQARTFNGLSTLLVTLSLVILASAFQRLRLYERAYGYTELRLYVYVFMLWLGIVFLWFVATLWWRPQRFAVGALAAALGFVITLNLVNPDAFIASRNLARYRQDGKLDAWYLTTLSEDATPALLSAIEEVTGEEQRVLVYHLWDRFERMRDRAGWRSWQSAHAARWRAYGLLGGDARLDPAGEWRQSRELVGPPPEGGPYRYMD